MSQITVIKGWGDFMKNMPSWESMTDFDENDPRSVADMLRVMKDGTGQDVGIEGEEMLGASDRHLRGVLEFIYNISDISFRHARKKLARSINCPV